jgi:hypothetical protein
MPKYQNRLVQHLSRYRRDRLGVARCGTFRHKGVDRAYGHILPRELRWLNIPEPFRAEVRDYLSREKHVRLHKYFHHLNSSQAFALSLFYPYLSRANPSLSIELGVAPAKRWCFEAVPEPGENTNVDVLLIAEDKAPVYCEVKLSETEFGKGRLDKPHRDKIETLYRPRLDGKVDSKLLTLEAFCASYQILRNLWLAANNPRASVLFLLPKENDNLTSQLDRVLSLVGPELRKRARVVYVEPLLTALTSSAPPRNALAWYAEMLREKYVPKAAE